MDTKNVDYQRSLIIRSNAGDKSALKELVQIYSPYIRKHIKRYRQDQNDLFQEGCMGLLEGIEKYDTSRNGHPFFFLSSHIRGKVKHHIARSYYVVRTPTDKYWDLEHRAKITSIDYHDNDGVSFNDIFASSSETPEEAFESKIIDRATQKLFERIFSSISKEERELLRLRHIEGLSFGKTGEKLAEHLRGGRVLLKEAVRKRELKIMNNIKENVLDESSDSKSYHEWVLSFS